MTQTFKVGDLVRLKSGGPRMTVTEAGGGADVAGTIFCAWFDTSGQRKTGNFAVEAVTIAAEVARDPDKP